MAVLAILLCARADWAAGATATLAVSPTAMDDNATNAITLRAASLTNGETVAIDQCLDANRNGVWDPGDVIVQRFWLTDNAMPMIGGVTNISVAGDTNRTSGAIGTSFFLPSAGFGQRIDGRHLFRLTSPGGRFSAVTATLTVAANTAAQTISGIVQCSGSPVSNAVVLLYPGRALTGDPLVGALTDATGAYVLHAAPGTYGLLAWRSGYAADSLKAPVVTLETGAQVATNLNLLSATRTIAGRFQNAAPGGMVPAGFAVGATSVDGLVSLGFTGTNGEFSLPAAPGLMGAWTLFGDDARLHGLVRPAALPCVDVMTGSVAGIQVTLTPGTALVYGTVKDPAGRPLIAAVSAADAAGIFIGGAVADAAGNYAVAVPPGSNVCATAVGARGTKDPFVFSQSPTFSLTNNQAVMQALVAKAAPFGITGTVQDDLGNPVAGLSVKVSGTAGSTNWVALDGRTDAGGAYVVPVAAGTWQVSLPTTGASGLAALGCLSATGRAITVNAGTGTVCFVVSRATATLTASARPAAGGTVTGDGPHELLSWAVLAPTPADGFRFVGWDDGVRGSVRTVQVTHAAAYVAHFGQAVSLAVGVTPAAGGTVTGGGVYGVGGSATLTATPAVGYRFAGWSDGETNAMRTLLVLPDTVCTARFVPVGTVVGAAVPGWAGAVTGSGVYDVGTTALVVACATNVHALFSRWADGASLATQSIRVVSGATVRTALFASAVVITASVCPAAAGSVKTLSAPTGGALATGAQYLSNATQVVTLTAAASNGWRLVCWSDGLTNAASRIVSLRGDTNVAALFVARTTVTVQASPVAGWVSGGGVYDAGATITLSATPVAGWRFAGWSDGDTNAVRLLVVPSADAVYTALFVQRVKVTTTASPAQAGTVSGDGTYDVGTTVTLSATTTNAAYRFKQWQDGDTNAVRSLTVSAAAAYTALFVARGTVVGLAQPVEAGIVSGGGVFDAGASVALAASSTNAGFVFSRWSDGLTTTARTVAVWSGVATQTALFATSVLIRATAVPPEGGTMTASPLPPEGGMVTNGVKYARSTAQVVTLIATTGLGWQWAGWSDGVKSAARTVGLATNAVLTARFTRQAVRVTTYASPAAGGTLSGGGTYPTWTTAVVTATSLPGYRFARWENGETNPVRSVTLTWSDVSCVATFVQQSTVLAVAQPPEAGAVAGGGVYDVGQGISLVAVSTNQGCVFSRWADGVSTTARMWQVSSGTNIVRALFVPAVTVRADVAPAGAGAVTVTPAPPEGGSLSAGVKYASNDALTVRLTTTASNRWRFVAWSDGLSNTLTRTLSLRAGTNVTACFQRQATIMTTASPGTGGTTSGGGTYDVGATVSLRAAAAPGWRFASWSDGDTNAVRLVTVADGATTYTARFYQQQTLVVVAQPAVAGTCAGGGVYDAMSSVSIAAVVTNVGYRFKQWTGGYTANPLTVTLAQPLTTFTAQFVPGGTVTVACQPPQAGRGTGGGVYDPGTQVVVTACSTNADYVFSRWSDGVTTTGRTWRVVQGTNNVCTALFTNAVILRAALSPTTNGTLSATPTPPEGGILSNGVKYASNTVVMLSVVPGAGWRITGWSDGATTAATRTVSLAASTNLTARLAAFATLTADPLPADGGTVTGGGDYALGDTAGLTALPSTGSVFLCWQDGFDGLVRTVTVTSNVTCKAYFARLIALTAQASPAAAGLVIGGGSYANGSVVTLSAVSVNPAYAFANWQDGVTAATRTVTVTAATTFTATFASVRASALTAATSLSTTTGIAAQVTLRTTDETGVALQAQAVPAQAGTVLGGGVYLPSSLVCLIAASTNATYGFAHWQDGMTSAVRTVTVVTATNYVATFVTPALAVHVNAWPSGGGFADGTELLAVRLAQGALAATWNVELPSARDLPAAALSLDYQAADADTAALVAALTAVIEADPDGSLPLMRVLWLGGRAVAETPFGAVLQVEQPSTDPDILPVVWRLVPVSSTNADE